MYKTILFDFDGTVFDTGEGIMKSVQYAALQCGYESADPEEFRSFVGPPLRESFKRYFGVDLPQVEVMIAKYRERYSGPGLRECAPYPGVVELVRELRGMGAVVCVATGKPTAFAGEILERGGLGELFNDVLGSEFDGTRSQKWEVITELLDKYGQDGAVMVGDRDNDVRGAKKCSIPCVGVAWGYAEPGELEREGAIAVAKDTNELKSILIG